MRRTLTITLVLMGILLIGAGSAFAQETAGAQPQGKSRDLLLVTAGFAMAIAAAGCGYAQSKALTAGCEGVSRNPGAADTIRVFIILGLAFIEFLALLTFVVVLMIYIGK
jgi:F-type H+-transporting ATPase subunit c